MAVTLVEKSLIEIKLGGFGVASSSALKDPALLPIVQNYKRQVASRMAPLGKDDIGRKIPNSEYFVSRKIDGEFTALIYKEGEVVSLNPGGTVRIGLPWHLEAAALLKQAGFQEAMIAGELYVTNRENRRSRVHDVISLVRQPKSQDDLLRLRFAIFDLIQMDGRTSEVPYSENWETIESVFRDGERVHPVEMVRLKSHHEIAKQFETWVEDEGAEGVVVRSDSTGNYKVKPRHTLDAVVIGYTESTEDRQGMLHDLLLGLVRRDGSIQVLGRVGGGFSDDDRRTMLSDLNDMTVPSEYAEVNSDHVAYNMVSPEWVVEISCLDLISQNTRGGPVNRMVLNWNREDKRYQVVRRMPLVSIISPQFVRLREDKTLDPSDVRIAQVTDRVPVEMSDIDAAELKLPTSQLLRREVYTKQLRGETMVRKFLLWQTNKQGLQDEYPAFVVYYTDFSPSRKTPLTREIRVTNSKSQSVDLFQKFKKDFVKKGWNRVDDPDPTE